MSVRVKIGVTPERIPGPELAPLPTYELPVIAPVVIAPFTVPKPKPRPQPIRGEK